MYVCIFVFDTKEPPKKIGKDAHLIVGIGYLRKEGMKKTKKQNIYLKKLLPLKNNIYDILHM